MNNWEILFDQAMVCLDSMNARGAPMPEWSFGGGTVLMLEYQHRMSHDVDISLHDPQYLTMLSPRLNDVAESITDNYVEMSNFLKLTLPEGEIDFIVAPSLTKRPYKKSIVRRRSVLLESPEEIAAKKVFYRAADLQVRDVFDLAVVLQNDASSL